MCNTKLGLKSLLAGLLAISTCSGWAQTCPTDATDTGVGVTLSALRINPDGSTGPAVGPSPIGICECIRLVMNISYVPIGASGGKTAFFEGGTMTVRTASGSFIDIVTPASGVPLVGNPADPAGAACGAGAVLTVSSEISGDYCVNPADIDADGNITFLANYVGGNVRFGGGIPNQPTGTTAINVHVDQGPSCTIAPATQTICSGASATFTASATGEAPPFTFTWSGPNGFTATGPTITINNAQEANEGTYTATVTDSHGCTSTCTAQLIVNPCQPDIEVTKEVACYLPGDTCGTYSKLATGVRDGECPAFCYRITVANANNGVTVTTLTVNDTLLGDISGLFASALPLVPGESVTVEIKAVTLCQDTHNVVTAEGRSDDGLADVDTDFADAVVLNINLECDLTLFSSFDMDGNANNNSVQLPAGSVDTSIEFNLVLRNTGSSTITVTDISGLPALVDCTDLVTPVVPVLPFDLGPGESATLSACVLVSCPGAQFSVQAHGVASDEGGTLCVFDENGDRVADSTDVCPAVVTCEQAVTCRTTGGGVLLPGTTDDSCITVETTIFPLETPNGLVINKITHGGQLGAPFSQEDCGEILGNPCIRGQWQHVRHYQGTANPRDVIDMNFHSNTPKGVFDSLNCACLGCCDPETGAFITPITVGSLCNPDDHKVCGPEPRPAPANAIIFSGIGRITPEDDTRGPRADRSEWVVFRVYIEDRSEPGGFHPKGAIEPADIYCFQAWKTGIKVSKRPDFDTVSPEFRRALGQANCDFLAALRNGTLPIGTLPPPTVQGVTADIQDCGPMSTGNHQIHPSTSATCDQ